MSVNYWLLPIALLLLWFPRQWLRFGGWISKTRRPPEDKSARDVRDVSLKYSVEFKKSRNWVDFFRAIAGSLAISYGCFSYEPGASRMASEQIFTLQAAIFVIAVIIQTIRIEGKFALVAPVFFLLGLSFGIVGWKAAAFACIAVWTINLTLPGPVSFLFVFAGLEVCFGLLLPRQASPRAAMLAAALAILPVLFSALTKRRLVRMNKKTKTVRRQNEAG